MDSIILQYIVIGALFCFALVYVFRKAGKSFRGEKTCSKGCDCRISEKKETTT